jgi:hypothetical protein
MPLQATSGAASYDAFGGGVAVVPNYIEDVMSTWLYTGNGSTQTITNGVDLSTKGGLVWIKSRDAGSHFLYDTARGVNNYIRSDATSAQVTSANSLTAFNTTGFSIGNSLFNNSAVNYASWTFRKQPKFFDVVTYTGTFSNLAVNHNLGSVPGCIIVKSVSGPSIWSVYHRSLGATKYLRLNQTTGETTSSTPWNNTAPTSTQFTVGSDYDTNGVDETYIAYLFAHDAGGFGLTGTDNVISCGSFTTDGSGNATVSLGYEPQWLMVKSSTTTQNWYIEDNMRAFNLTGRGILFPNLSNAEAATGNSYLSPSSTGFAAVNGQLDASTTYIYIAIRRGPMKVPTLGTSVFTPVARTGTGSATTLTSAGFPPDLYISQERTLSSYFGANWFDRLRDRTKDIFSASTDAEFAASNTVTGFDAMQGVILGTDGANYGVNASGVTYANWNFRRAPSFFDEVCYTGTGANGQVINHNLSAIPEMVIIKGRDSTLDWFVYQAGLSSGNSIYLNRNYAQSNDGGPAFSLSSTALTISRTYVSNLNSSAINYVAYLFATCAGVSKVGSYTGTGTTKQIDCGFTAGARFVLIKRTDSTGDWYVWDSARGIVAGNDPYLLLNSAAAEVTNTDYVDTYSAGFEISSTAPAAINANGGTFIFLAVS